MLSLVAAILIFYFVWTLVNSGGNAKKKDRKKAGDSAAKPRKSSVGTFAVPRREKSKTSLSGLNPRDFEDRENDWLARQIREETKYRNLFM